MENNSAEKEQVLELWSISKSDAFLPATFIFVTVFTLFIISFVWIIIISKSTSLPLLIFLFILFILTVAVLPEFMKSLKAVNENTEVYITERGVYKRNLDNSEKYSFVAWDLMTGYDITYLASTNALGKLFPRPTKFYIKSKYEDDSFSLLAFGEHIDVLRAYCKEHNVPFGYLKSS